MSIPNIITDVYNVLNADNITVYEVGDLSFAGTSYPIVILNQNKAELINSNTTTAYEIELEVNIYDNITSFDNIKNLVLTIEGLVAGMTQFINSEIILLKYEKVSKSKLLRGKMIYNVLVA
jgi:hypothetical protein